MFSRILMPLDTSARGPGIVAAAAEVAARFDGLLIPMRALTSPVDYAAAASPTPHDDLEQILAREASAALTALTASLRGVRVEVPVIRWGWAPTAILSAASELEADSIILGAHSYGGWDRVLGTTAAYVANRARCDVLVIHRGS